MITTVTLTLTAFLMRLAGLSDCIVYGALFGEAEEQLTPRDALCFVIGAGIGKRAVTVEADGPGGRAVTAEGNVIYFEVVDK